MHLKTSAKQHIFTNSRQLLDSLLPDLHQGLCRWTPWGTAPRAHSCPPTLNDLLPLMELELVPVWNNCNLLKQVSRVIGMIILDYLRDVWWAYLYVFVCLLAYFNDHMVKLHKMFCTCCPGMWFSPLMTVKYIMYFRFCGWRHVCP